MIFVFLILQNIIDIFFICIRALNFFYIEQLYPFYQKFYKAYPINNKKNSLSHHTITIYYNYNIKFSPTKRRIKKKECINENKCDLPLLAQSLHNLFY